jgi:hypothetical protein
MWRAAASLAAGIGGFAEGAIGGVRSSSVKKAPSCDTLFE